MVEQCSLCGREAEDGSQPHWIGCARAAEPELTDAEAVKRGLLYREPDLKEEPPKVEVLKEGSMTTEPWDPEEYLPQEEGEGQGEAGECEYPDCGKAKYSAHPRAKYCDEHRDPKNRKE